MYDVAVIGGGVSGCAIVRELSRFNLRIVLIERCAEVGFGTTKTNSPADSLKGRLAVRGNELFDKLREELNFGFRRIGEVVVARDKEEIPILEQLLRQGEERGVPGLEIWDRKRLRREEPNLSHKLVAALYAPSAGVINPYEFAFALIENAVENGVELLVEAQVQGIKVREGGGMTVELPGASLDSRFVINAAGVFSDQVARMVGLEDFTIHPRKGEEFMLDKRLRGLVQRLIFPVPSKKTKGTLIIPTFDGTLMVGPTAQDTEDRYDLATSAEGAGKVFDFVRKICPAISPRDVITEFAGLRAVSSTNDFIIGPTAVKGFINVAGIQSPGLTASPAIAEYVRDLLAEEGLELAPKRRFRRYLEGPPRFAAMELEERRRAIASNPLFARVVCRCELVTEAEIHDAIDHGARTLDGIKFRSRAGMGRCQGGFCTSRCMEILTRRTRTDLTSITKRGGGSWLVTEMDNDQHPRPRLGKEGAS